MDTELLIDDFMRACEYGKLDIVRQYIAEDGCVNVADSSGWTGLMWAARYGHIDCIRTLIAAGADITAKGSCGRTAIIPALSYRHYEAAQLLVELGADIYIKDSWGLTAIDYCKNKEIMTGIIKLHRQRTNIEAAIASTDSPEIVNGFDSER